MRTPAAARRAVARARARNADGRDGVRPVGMFTGTPSTRFAAGDHIPGAVERVASFGLAIEHPRGWAGGVRVRHFGPAPLVEDGSVRSDGTTVVNLRAGYALNERLGITLDVYNLLDSEDDDISYDYESRLPGEAAPVADIHSHPVEPRTWRLGLRGSF